MLKAGAAAFTAELPGVVENLHRHRLFHQVGRGYGLAVEVAVSAGKEQQRPARLRRLVQLDDAADHDEMIAAFEAFLQAAADGADAALQARPALPGHEAEGRGRW